MLLSSEYFNFFQFHQKNVRIARNILFSITRTLFSINKDLFTIKSRLEKAQEEHIEVANKKETCIFIENGKHC